MDYNINEYIRRIEYIRSEIPDICISTDLIVGFPNESDKMFEDSLEKLNECAFSFMHVFPYSKREMTVAALMDDQLSNEVKKDRVHRAQRLSDLNNIIVLNKWINKIIDVLCENKLGEYVFGYSSQYLPVLVKSDSDLINKR